MANMDEAVQFPFLVGGQGFIAGLRRELVHSLPVTAIEFEPEQRPRRFRGKVVALRPNDPVKNGNLANGGCGGHEDFSRSTTRRYQATTFASVWVSDSMRPSRRRITRRAFAAMSSSCVTMMIVLPARFMPRSMCRISPLVRVSRLPVGSSARTTWGSFTRA